MPGGAPYKTFPKIDGLSNAARLCPKRLLSNSILSWTNPEVNPIFARLIMFVRGEDREYLSNNLNAILAL